MRNHSGPLFKGDKSHPNPFILPQKSQEGQVHITSYGSSHLQEGSFTNTSLIHRERPLPKQQEENTEYGK